MTQPEEEDLLMASTEFQSVIEADCWEHGLVKARYNPDCWWWECPQIVDCGFALTTEDLARLTISTGAPTGSPIGAHSEDDQESDLSDSG